MLKYYLFLEAEIFVPGTSSTVNILYSTYRSKTIPITYLLDIIASCTLLYREEVLTEVQGQ
jgi:hypothetical protein